MFLRLGFDLDGVLADMEGELERLAGVLFGVEPAKSGGPQMEADALETADRHLEPGRSSMVLSLKQQRELWDHVRSTEDFWAGLKEIEPGAVRRLGRLVLDRRWEVVFLTRRPPTSGDAVQRQTQRWLSHCGLDWPSVCVTSGSRGQLAASLQLDVVVDDRPENCVDVIAESEAKAILVWRAGEQFLPVGVTRQGIHVVKSTMECLDVLEELAATAPPGWFGRLKERLGLKTET